MRAQTRTILIALTLACISRAGVNLQAQPAPVQQFQENQRNRQQETSFDNLANTNAPELYPGENQDVGPQYILRLRPTRTLFQGTADTQYAWTDNNRLSHDNKTSTAMAINTVEFSLAPTAYDLGPGKFAPELGYRSQWYNYGLGDHGDEDVLNFNAQTIFLSGQYTWNEKWLFDAELDYTRLLSQANYQQFYTEVQPTIGVARFFTMRDDLVLGVGVQEYYHFTSVPSVFGSRRDVNDRLDNTFNVLATYQVMNGLYFTPYYRFENTYYRETAFGTDRNDFLHTVGGALYYYFTPQFSARIYANASFRTSDDPNTTSYEQFNSGIGASFVLRF